MRRNAAIDSLNRSGDRGNAARGAAGMQ